MIEIQLDRILKREGRTYYWLAKQSGVSHNTLWRMKKGKAQGIKFDTLESICRALQCDPGELLNVPGLKKKDGKS
jgi:putative transcriptional regulator